MILDEILARTADRISHLESRQTSREADQAYAERGPGCSSRYPLRSMADAISGAGGDVAVIAELKYASPSGLSCPGQLDPEVLAGELIAGGCTGLSVLTEPYFFSGSPATLTRVRRISPVPVLRKDFIIDERQVYETRALGADAVLLIARVLGDRLPGFVGLSRSAGLEPLVEVHTPGEVNTALASGATLVGINNRNLGTMHVDRETTRRLSPLLRKEGCLVISMSGIRGPEDIRSLRDYCDAFLVGTALMQSPDPKQRLEEFLCA